MIVGRQPRARQWAGACLFGAALWLAGCGGGNQAGLLTNAFGSDAGARQVALDSIRGEPFKPSEASLTKIFGQLEGPDWALRQQACRVLEIVGPKADESQQIKIIGRLLNRLDDEAVDVMLAAGTALAAFGDAALPKLMDATQQSEGARREAAFFALGCMGARIEPALPIIVGDLSHQRPDVRLTAAGTLLRTGLINPPAIQRLAQMVLDPAENIDVRLMAASVLGLHAQRDQMAQAALTRAQADANPLLRERAQEALAPKPQATPAAAN